MKSLQNYISQMNQLLMELVQVATQLRDMSLQVISEEDLEPLQKRQEHLLKQLELVDQEIRENYRHQLDAAAREQIHQQLQCFQELNREFVQNLNAGQGVIQFDLRRFPEENEDFSARLNRLKKASSAPDSAEAVESEENEESR